MAASTSCEQEESLHHSKEVLYHSHVYELLGLRHESATCEVDRKDHKGCMSTERWSESRVDGTVGFRVGEYG